MTDEEKQKQKEERFKKMYYPMAYKMYESQENGEFIQFAAFDGGMPMAVVAFDFFNRAPKIGANDMNLMRIVGRMMAEIAGENW